MNTTTLADSTLTVSSTVVLYTYIIYFSVNLPLNCYVIFLLLSKYGRTDMSVVFTVNIAIAEMVLCLVALFSALRLIYCSPSSDILLDIAFAAGMSARFLFQCCVCLERYLAVLHPVTFLRFKPLRYRVVCSISAWICALGVGTVSIFSFPVPPYNAATITCFIILNIELYCCVSVLKDLLRPAPGEKQDGKTSTAKKKAFQVISTYLLAVFIQNIPITVLFGVKNTLSLDDFQKVQEVCLIDNFVAGFVQPFCVLHKAGKLRFLKCVKR